MSVLSKDFRRNNQFKTNKQINLSIPFWKSYMAFAERQEEKRVFWFLKAIMVIPCVIMVPTIILMSMATSSYIWFVALTMILFFANVIVHIGETKSTIYVPLYHASIFIMILLPVINYLMAL